MSAFPSGPKLAPKRSEEVEPVKRRLTRVVDGSRLSAGRRNRSRRCRREAYWRSCAGCRSRLGLGHGRRLEQMWPHARRDRPLSLALSSFLIRAHAASLPPPSRKTCHVTANPLVHCCTQSRSLPLTVSWSAYRAPARLSSRNEMAKSRCASRMRGTIADPVRLSRRCRAHNRAATDSSTWSLVVHN